MLPESRVMASDKADCLVGWNHLSMAGTALRTHYADYDLTTSGLQLQIRRVDQKIPRKRHEIVLKWKVAIPPRPVVHSVRLN